MLILRLCRIFAFHNLQNHLKPHNMICNYSITRHIDKELCNNNGTVEDRTGHINSIVGMHDQIYKIGANKKNGQRMISGLLYQGILQLNKH